MSEEMFIKDNVQMEVSEPKEKAKPKPKKKKQLTEKQLEGLAKGRAKMAEKRKMKKAMEDRKKQLKEKDLQDMEAVQENQTNQKKSRANKKKVIQESGVATANYYKKKKNQEASLDKFNKLKMSALKHIGSSQELDEFENIMNGVSKDMAKNPENLYTYLREHADRLTAQSKEKL